MSEASISNGDAPTLERNLKGHRGAITSVQFNPINSNHFASSSTDGTLMLWNVTRDVRCFKFSGHGDVVTSVKYSSSGNLLVSGSQDHTIRLWKPTVRGESFEIKAHSGAVRTVAFSPDDKNVSQ